MQQGILFICVLKWIGCSVNVVAPTWARLKCDTRPVAYFYHYFDYNFDGKHTLVVVIILFVICLLQPPCLWTSRLHLLCFHKFCSSSYCRLGGTRHQSDIVAVQDEEMSTSQNSSRKESLQNTACSESDRRFMIRDNGRVFVCKQVHIWWRQGESIYARNCLACKIWFLRYTWFM